MRRGPSRARSGTAPAAAASSQPGVTRTISVSRVQLMRHFRQSTLSELLCLRHVRRSSSPRLGWSLGWTMSVSVRPGNPILSGEFPRDLEVMCSTAAKRDRAPWVQPQAIWGLERDRLGSSEVAPMSHAARPDGDRGLASSCLFPRSFSHAGAVGVKLGGMVK